MNLAQPDYGDEPDEPIFRQAVQLDTKTGAFGDPTLATKEKGKLFFEAQIEDLIDGLKQIFSFNTLHI
jgi:creatinine amidohydrolase/Fe(II)-dependent formamide hydrolase-like protein